MSKISEDLLAKAAALRELKNMDYSRGDVNPHAFFYDTARKKGITPAQVWGVLSEKHNAAIDSFIKNGSESEPLEGRIIDAINYLLIFAENAQNPAFFRPQ